MPKIVAQKKEWIKIGYKLFSKHGISGIIVEKMAKMLVCNKSSFYWHFKTKNEFIDNVISYWVSIKTEQIITLTNSENSAKEKFEKLIDLSFKKDPYLDFIFYLKRYALKDKKNQNIIDMIDNQRIKYVSDILTEMGMSNQEAKIKSTLFYKYLIGYHEMIRYKKQSKNYLQEVKKDINQFIKF